MEENQANATVIVDELITHPSELEPAPASAHKPRNGRFAAMAPYWKNGLKNTQGLKLAEEINALIKLKKLEENEEAIKAILKSFPAARSRGIDVLAEEFYLNDPWRKANLAEPIKLLGGSFVRDKDGAYRPSAGGSPVLLDKDEEISIKNGDHNSVAAATELMKAKGWTAIRVSGNKKTQESLYLAAAFGGIDVLDYAPSKETQAKLADMFVREAEQRKTDVEILNRSQPCVNNGVYEGKITNVSDGFAKQKAGRDPDMFVKHDLSKLSRELKEGEIVGITYKDGLGQVSQKEVVLENASPGR